MAVKQKPLKNECNKPVAEGQAMTDTVKSSEAHIDVQTDHVGNVRRKGKPFPRKGETVLNGEEDVRLS